MNLAIIMQAMADAECSNEQMARVALFIAKANEDESARKRADAARRQREFKARKKTGQPIDGAADADNALPASSAVTEREQALPALPESGAYKDNRAGAPGFPVGFSYENPSLVNPLPSEGPPTPEAAGHGDQTEPGRKPSREAASAGDEPDDPKARKPIDILAECVSRQTAADIVEHRRKLRKPLTARAAELTAKALIECGDPEAGAAMWIALGWQGFRVDWFRNEQAKSNARAGPQRHAKRNSFLADFERELSEKQGHAETWEYHEAADDTGKTIDLLGDEYGAAD